MSAGFPCGITLELFTDKYYGHPLSIPVTTQRAVTRAASGSSQIQFYKSLNYFFLCSPRKKAHQNRDSMHFPFS